MPLVDFDYVVIGGGIVGSAVSAWLADSGKSVALIERGGSTLGSLAPPRPKVHCIGRAHLGCDQARNHVLGGNGHFWGGGLKRPTDYRALACLGFDEEKLDPAAENVSPLFDELEQSFGVARPPVRKPYSVIDPRIGVCELAEICVLAGRSGNLPAAAIARLKASPACQVYTDTELVAFESESVESSEHTITAVRVRTGQVIARLGCKHVVIAAGAIDTVLISLQHAEALNLAKIKDRIGSHVHDHFSLPIARFRLPQDERTRALLAPSFCGGKIYGRHFELRSTTGWRARGFLHFQFIFNEVSPYREIKKILALSRQKASPAAFGRAILPMFKKLPHMARLGFERWGKKRLYLSSDLPIIATLDFESCPRAEQRLQFTEAGPQLAWSIGDADVETFIDLIGKASYLLSELKDKFGGEIEPLFDFNGAATAREYLHEHATDAFHVGGGLQAGGGTDDVVDENLKLRGTSNVHVVSAAVFRRPGVANPTHTLLALAKRFVTSQLSDKKSRA